MAELIEDVAMERAIKVDKETATIWINQQLKALGITLQNNY